MHETYQCFSSLCLTPSYENVVPELEPGVVEGEGGDHLNEQVQAWNTIEKQDHCGKNICCFLSLS